MNTDLEKPGARSALPTTAPVDDCWSRIGVAGDGSCPELKHFIHCRNCPVHAAAGVQLLNRELPPGYREQWAAHFAQAKPPSAPGRLSALVFRLGREWLALPTGVLQEVAEPRKIHSLPHRRHGVVIGLVNIRGEILVCVSLARLLGLVETPERPAALTSAGARRALLVLTCDNQRLVIPVDEVGAIVRFQPEALQDPPATVTRAGFHLTRALLRWNEKTVAWLDADQVFAALQRNLA